MAVGLQRVIQILEPLGEPGRIVEQAAGRTHRAVVIENHEHLGPAALDAGVLHNEVRQAAARP
jgi:hypothetical protein